jgi:thioredoxin-dependent peroxiredoxin
LTFADHESYRKISKAMYGKTYFGNARTTFVIDADGKVAEVLRKIKPAEHDELVLKALAEAGPRVT